MSTSKDELKIWNVTTCNPIRTIASGYGLCGIFAPGDRHVVIGTKTGAVEALLSLSFLISMNSVLFFDFSAFIMKISSFEVLIRFPYFNLTSKPSLSSSLPSNPISFLFFDFDLD